MAVVSDELVELSNIRFHYRDWRGPGDDAPVLVLLHGYTSHARSWDAFAEAMAASHRVLALDQRGHGETGWAVDHDYGTAAMVDDLAGFVAALGIRRFALLGLSMGGLVAMAYAGLRPAELERLVIVDIAPTIARAGLENIQAGVARSAVFDSEQAAFEQARRDNPVPPIEHHRHRVHYSLMRMADGRFTYRYDPALRDPGLPRNRLSEAEGWQRVAAIAVPTLLIRGENSNILDAGVAERMLGTLADGRLAVVPGAGHPVPLDTPDAFLAVAREFLLAG